MGTAAAGGWARGDTPWPANDATKIKRSGTWEWTSHRYAAEHALATKAEGATLEFEYTGRTLVIGLDTLTPPNHYGPPELGALDISIDGKFVRTVRPRVEDRDVILLRSNVEETHRVRVIHRSDAGRVGARIRHVRATAGSSGDWAFVVSSEHHGALNDVRAVVTRGGQVVRETLVRNWLTGQCRIAALSPGNDYALELRAAGWRTWRTTGLSIKDGVETELPPVYLEREWDVPVDDFKFPTLGEAVVTQPGQTFRARFEGNRGEVRGVRVVRQQGPAMVSRRCMFTEDKAAAFYYHREGTVTLPADTPPGLYDLEVLIADERGTRPLWSRRCVSVVERYPADPVFLAFGHLDTWGQYQAEYLERIAAIANIIAPDMVLVSNEANPAYATGALYGLEMPYVINFGNHRGPEPGAWFAEPVGVVDFGREFSVVNFGRAWDTDTTEVAALLGQRAGTRIKVINAFESNAPVAELLDRHGVSLIHYAHGPGPAVATFGRTPTMRVGKVNSESFRVIRFRDGRSASTTYRNHATAAIPFGRTAAAPVRITYDGANDGTQGRMGARVENDLEEAFPNARAVFVLRRGAYRVTGAGIERVIESDDGKFTVLSVRFDLPAKGGVTVTVEP